MLYYAIVFLVIALIAGAAVGIAKILFFVFLVLFVVSLIMGRRARPTVWRDHGPPDRHRLLFAEHSLKSEGDNLYRYTITSR